MSKITLESDMTAGNYPVPAGSITLDSDTPAGTYTLDDFVPFAVKFVATVAAGYVVTIQDTSTGTLPTDEMVISWSNGKPTECPIGGSVSHTYPNASQYMVTQTLTRADGTSVTNKHPVYPGQITPPADTTPTPVSPPPPPPPVTTSPPVTTPPATSTPPPSQGAQPSATHVAAAIVTDAAGKTWTATAKVCDDATIDGVYLSLADADGNLHPGLRMRAYADCCDVGAVNGRDAFDYAGTLTVTYDGAVVFGPEAVQFPHDVFNKTIRYGKQAAWHPVDKTLFPNWAAGTPNVWDISQYDLSYNGLGVASLFGMGSGGARPDIAYVPEWDVPFVVAPSGDTFVVVRAAADHCGAWPLYCLDDNTGLPFDVTQYPDVNLLPPYQQGGITANPLAIYNNDPKAQAISGSKCKPELSHQTGYAFVAAAATGTAHDKFHAAVWANYALTAGNPDVRQRSGVMTLAERATAWALRSLFLGSQVSCMPEYFAAQLEINRAIADALPKNPCGILGTYMRPTDAGLHTGIAVWQENYDRIVLDPIAHKLPQWMPFNQYLASFIPIAMNAGYWQLSTIYVLSVLEAEGGAYLADYPAMLRASLVDSLSNAHWSAEDAAAATAPGVTQDQVTAIIAKYNPNAKAGDFLNAYVAQPDNYSAEMRAACACAVNAGVDGAAAAWAICESVPTKPDFNKGWGFNIVPRPA